VVLEGPCAPKEVDLALKDVNDVDAVDEDDAVDRGTAVRVGRLVFVVVGVADDVLIVVAVVVIVVVIVVVVDGDVNKADESFDVVVVGGVDMIWVVVNHVVGVVNSGLGCVVSGGGVGRLVLVVIVVYTPT